MSGNFEESFVELQVDIIDICLDFVHYCADEVYIICSAEGRMISSDYFYKINGRIVERSKINTISPNYDVSPDNQGKYLGMINEDIIKMLDLCKAHNKPMPTEIKMIYDMNKNTLDAQYKYDNQWLGHPDKELKGGPDCIANEWREEIKKLNGQ